MEKLPDDTKNKCLALLETAKANLKTDERSLRLMEAGLKEYPLERDFFMLQKFKFDTQRKEVEMLSGLSTMILKIEAGEAPDE